MDDTTAVCNLCGNEVAVLDNIRQTGKSPGTWKCGKRCTRLTQLNREYGHWPNDAFKLVPKEQREQFYRGMRDFSSIHDVRAYCSEHLTAWEKTRGNVR